MKPIKKTDAEWMMVWDRPELKVKRIVIQLFDDGSCAAVERYEREYLDGNNDATHIVMWSHYEPIETIDSLQNRIEELEDIIADFEKSWDAREDILMIQHKAESREVLDAILPYVDPVLISYELYQKIRKLRQEEPE
jgi:hypothetical protein